MMNCWCVPRKSYELREALNQRMIQQLEEERKKDREQHEEERKKDREQHEEEMKKVTERIVQLETERTRERDRKAKMEAGEFFAPISKIWTDTNVLVEDLQNHFAKISRVDGYFCKIKDYNNVIDNIDNHINNQQNQVQDGDNNTKPPAKRAISFASSSNSAILDGSVSGNPSSPSESRTQSSNASSTGKQDFTGGFLTSLAHLVPKSDCKFSYGVACQAVCGKQYKDKELLKLLADGMSRSSTNLIRVPADHGLWFNSSPCWILVPICDVDFLKNWTDDQGYYILVMADGYNKKTKKTAEGAYKKTAESAYQNLCGGNYNDQYMFEGDQDDINKATDRLREMVLALAETLLSDQIAIKPQMLNAVVSNEEGSNLSRAKVFTATEKSMTEHGVKVPLVLEDFDGNALQVLKCKVYPDESGSFPDPMLLLIKAAVNWSWRCGQKLLPACSLDDENDEEEEELVFVSSTPPCFPKIPSFIEVRQVTPEPFVE